MDSSHGTWFKITDNRMLTLFVLNVIHTQGYARKCPQGLSLRGQKIKTLTKIKGLFALLTDRQSWFLMTVISKVQ